MDGQLGCNIDTNTFQLLAVSAYKSATYDVFPIPIQRRCNGLFLASGPNGRNLLLRGGFLVPTPARSLPFTCGFTAAAK